MLFYKPPILCYHHVAEEGDPVATVSPAAFRRQIERLAEEGRVVSLEEWVRAMEKKEKGGPSRPLMLTFDDGYLDTYTEAFPVLQRHRLPATLFMVTDWVEKPGFVTWRQLREMARSGWTIGSHTKSHPYLPDLSRGRWEEELGGSKKILEDKLQSPVALLSYPVGGYTDEIIEAVRGAGYRAACTTNRAGSRLFHPYRLSRIKMTEASHPLVVWAKTSGYYEHYKRTKASH